MDEFTYKSQVLEIIDTLDLESDTNKSILKSRFVGEVLNYEKRRDDVKKYYNLFRFIVTTGSILLPAILSIGQMDPNKLPKNFDTLSYWTAWSISLMVTASNGFLQLFSLDKNYFEFALTTEQLKTEGWQFFQLSGKYEDCESHKEAYKSFNKSVENIKRKQVEKEFPGKADVNKNKKEKPKYNFQEELKKQLPDKYEGYLERTTEKDIEKNVEKVDELSILMSDKMEKLDGLVKLLENKNISEQKVDNVKGILHESISEQVGEAAIEVLEKKNTVKDTKDTS
tara:strand:- start:371 stop:1219 length:849 start_codon:yes stop_codon:yes gene_type:complete